MTRDDVELYVMGQYDGDIAALEAAIAADPALAAIAAEEAQLELKLRAIGAEATFCPACDDLVRDERCNSCGAAIKPGGYTVERVLVSNAHGRMYVARDADGRRVALKELAFVHAPSPEALAAFERETTLLRALEHPRIPRFLASFEEGQGVHLRYYLAQELVEGSPLDRLDDHWYTEAEVTALARQVLEILVYLQSLSPMVVHRDIKPANLLKRADGAIALVDFGAAHVQGTTAGSTTIGTFGYMPIEQLAGIVDATTDGYALGMTLMHLLTRQEPWRLTQSRTTLNVSAPLRGFLDKLVAAEPRDRFASAKDALAALDRPVAIVPAKPARTSRAGWLALAATAGALATAGGFGLYRLATSGSDLPRAHVAPERKAIDAGITGWVDPQVFEVQNVPPVPPVPPMTGFGSFAAPTTVPEHRWHQAKPISWSLKHAKLVDVVLLFANTCGVNMVVPDTLEASITVSFADAPCDGMLESILEAHGLWYVYDPDANLIRVAPRHELDRDGEDAYARLRFDHTLDEALPPGKSIDLDLKDVPLRDALRLITGGKNITLVMPETIQGSVTISGKDMPWQGALSSVLAAKGLWYRFRSEGAILRIAPRHELDREDEDALARAHRHTH